jgi:hypothetical protein
MTVYSPQGKNTGAAVVVFPGGGYQGLAIYFEATEVGDWLTPKGITFAAEMPLDGGGGVSEIGAVSVSGITGGAGATGEPRNAFVFILIQTSESSHLHHKPLISLCLGVG